MELPMKNYLLLPFLLILMLMAACGGDTSFEESEISKNWQFKKQSETDWSTATVPGTVHTDLLANGKIENPFYRLNEHDLQWIDKENWEYQTTF